MKILLGIWAWIKLPFWIIYVLAEANLLMIYDWYRSFKVDMTWTYEQKQKAHRAILAACTGGAGIKNGKMKIIVEKDKSGKDGVI
jgi:transcriptional regulatory protein LevR